MNRVDDQALNTACEQACQAIAPAWPLDQAIAVNPHWQRIGRPVREVAARMAVLAGMPVFPPRPMHADAWRAGRILPADLSKALALMPQACAAGLDERACVGALGLPEAPNPSAEWPRLPLLIDVLDDEGQWQRRLSWRQAVTHQISQTCAAYFDTDQAEWQPERRAGLYAFWRHTLIHDHGIGVLMGLPHIGSVLDALPATAQEAEAWALARLGLPASVWADYLEAVLLSIQGWAAWCAYLRWQATLQGQTDPHLRELLAIRLAWGAILLACKGEAAAPQAFADVQQAWRGAPALLASVQQSLVVDEVWQLARDLSAQRQMLGRLPLSAPRTGRAQAPDMQAAFCIDVRSEPLRRALERHCPGVQTLGVAGFFGLPLDYTPPAAVHARPQLPGLLAPTLHAADGLAPRRQDHGPAAPARAAALAHARQRHWALEAPWHAASHWPGAAYAYVEAAGVAYLAPLARWLWPGTPTRARDDLQGVPARYRARCRPALQGLSLDERVALAHRVLQGMGLQEAFAPLVVLVGHGSQSHNNAQAAALECGACGGQSGEVNARVLAQLLNEPLVREGLRARGLRIPEQTSFLAALHNTTTDEVEVFDLHLQPDHARIRWEQATPSWRAAAHQVRQERAPHLAIAPQASPARLLSMLRRRAADGAQTRPEWGLAGNAALVMAPRWRTQGQDLEGRCFLHDYDPERDTEGHLLTQLMTAPMVVAHWINWQYHASTCAPEHLGSGNKLLHNVVGGRLGVFEGNGGDLRVGLSRQSVHDGHDWVHDPVRLTVLIDAPAERIEAVIAAHPSVRHLADNGWLHLMRFDGQGLARRVAPPAAPKPQWVPA